MLVLTRKVGQTIVIKDDIEVKILDIKGGYVSVGITAPSDIKVFRQELLEQVRSEENAAGDRGANASGSRHDHVQHN